jgi:hypothetical protein
MKFKQMKSAPAVISVSSDERSHSQTDWASLNTLHFYRKLKMLLLTVHRNVRDLTHASTFALKADIWSHAPREFWFKSTFKFGATRYRGTGNDPHDISVEYWYDCELHS